MSPAILIFFIVFFLLCAELCYLIAKHKNLRKHFWAAMGFSFGPLALLPLVFIKSRKPL